MSSATKPADLGGMRICRLASAPDLLDLQRRYPQRYPMLLESSAAALDASAQRHARWDILLLTDGSGIVCEHDGTVRDVSGTTRSLGFFDALEHEWRANVAAIPDGPHGAAHVPFRGGWALFLGYELAADIEPVLALPPPPGGLPRALALRCPAALLKDHASGEVLLVAEPGSEDWLAQMQRDCQSVEAAPSRCAPLPHAVLREDAPTKFTDGVRRVIDYLHAGDVFQVNLSRRWDVELDAAVPAADLQAALRTANPAPFSGMLAWDDWAIASSSPERLVSIRGDIAETRPIAGTRPRLPDDDETARIRELVGHPKERAEHVMLVDLERNDLGRVATAGSVEVDELMTVESFAHVHHIVSNVRCRLREDVSPIDVIRAVFPGGTITGCPKVRCMQIIAELEGEGRGAYTGAMGWLNRDGDLDLNILIRTLEVEGSRLRFRTGAGIVVDSDPDLELQETRAKARGLLRALGVEG